jgi:arylsulfatase A-like enzyme
MKMKIAVFLSRFATPLAVLSANPDTAKPNVVFILADDLGWRDLGCYGSTFYKTPNIDKLARRGMLFTQAYATAPICSPTRASILSGLYPSRLGITLPSCQSPKAILEKQPLPSKASPSQKAITPASLTRLSREFYVLPECLKDAGYVTAHIGKWHCGWSPHGPEDQGFDFVWPGCEMSTSYFAPYPMAMADGRIDLDAIPAPAGEHLQDRMTDEAIHWLKTNPRRPFFLNYWAFLPHVPLQAHAELIDKYKAKADPQNPQHNPVYAAMIETLDRNVGRLLNTLDELGVADNTIVIFSSDNGGTDWTTHDDTPPTSNFPLREGKGTAYDGGTRVPLIVSLPDRVKSGAVSDALVTSVDIYPTLLEITGVKPKKDIKLDGLSIMPALRGEPLKRDAIFCLWPHYATAAGKGGRPAAWVRCGNKKLIRFFADNDDQTDRFELYDLAIDIGETNNLAALKPEQTRELNGLLGRFLAETQAVIPLPNPVYNPGAESKAKTRPRSSEKTEPNP